MKKSVACLGLVLLLVAAFAVAPAAAAPKLAGNWVINGKALFADGTVNPIQFTDLQIVTTSDPTLFYGTFTGPEGNPSFMTIMMDAGANMHFTVSDHVFGGQTNLNEFYTKVIGRGTASTNTIKGTWSDDTGKTGIFIMTRQP